MCLLLNYSFITVHIFISLLILEHFCVSLEIPVNYWPVQNRELTTTRRPARGKLRNMHQRHLGSTIMTHCAKDGVCISSSACDWDHIVQDDKGCLNEHKDFVCCSAASVQIQSNVFTGYD
ncbi:hypothetical protein SFRURICE_020601, partial [Spodoptera frugiperda]